MQPKHRVWTLKGTSQPSFKDNLLKEVTRKLKVDAEIRCKKMRGCIKKVRNEVLSVWLDQNHKNQDGEIKSTKSSND